MAKTILVTSGKGGTGKSTTSAFLGQALASRGKNVLLVELDGGLRSLDVALGVAKNVVLDFGDVARGTPLMDAVMPCSFCPGLYVLCASGSVLPVLTETLVKIMTEAQGRFDYILWDCPAGIGDTLRASAKISSLALVIATPDSSSVRAAQSAGRILLSEGVKARRLVIERCPDQPKKLRPIRDLDEIIDQTEIQLLGVIWEDPATRIAFNTGAPLPESSPNRKTFADLASRVLGERVPLGFH